MNPPVFDSNEDDSFANEHIQFEQLKNSLPLIAQLEGDTRAPKEKDNNQILVIESCKREFDWFLADIIEKNVQASQEKIDLVLANTKVKINEMCPLDEISKFYENFVYMSSSRKNKKKRNWNKTEIEIFLWVLIYYCEWKEIDPNRLEGEDWIQISKFFPNYNEEKCKFKWMSLQKSLIQSEPWTAEEDNYLRSLVEKYQKPKWTQISLEMGQNGNRYIRSPRQCRERWFNYLNPNLKKGNWTSEEDLNLLEEVLKQGRKWSQISKFLPGRNENSVKNRFFSLLKVASKKINEEEIIRKIYMKIKVIKDSLSQNISELNKNSESPRAYGQKAKNNVSLNNLSISNSSFVHAKTIHKRQKSKANTLANTKPLLFNNYCETEMNEEMNEDPEIAHIDEEHNKHMNVLEPVASSMVFESLDCIRDDLDKENSKRIPENNNVNLFYGSFCEPNEFKNLHHHANNPLMKGHNLEMNFTDSLPNEFQEVLSGDFSKIIESDHHLSAIKQISSISSFQNPDSKHSWINNMMKLEVVSPMSKYKNQKEVSWNKIGVDSPRSKLEHIQITKLKNDLINLSIEGSKERNELINLSSMNHSNTDSNQILHLSNNEGDFNL